MPDPRYTRLAPLYDRVVALLEPGRRRSVAAIGVRDGETVLISGVGTGKDLAHLPRGARIRAVDLTPAMLERARPRAVGFADAELLVGDATALPFADASCDVALLHLILAVVPDPRAALAEAARVVRPGGRAAVWDKFVPHGRSDRLLRLLDPITRSLATGVTTRFEEVVAAVPEWRVASDEPDALGGLFRRIRLERR